MRRVPVIDNRPASGSCVRCRASLGLASVRQDGLWHCSTACALGQPRAAERELGVPEDWLYHRPRRFFGKRSPKELRR